MNPCRTRMRPPLTPPASGASSAGATSQKSSGFFSRASNSFVNRRREVMMSFGTAVRLREIDADDQERSIWLWLLGAFTGSALVRSRRTGSGKQETERAALETAARREAGPFWPSAVILVCLSRYIARFFQVSGCLPVKNLFSGRQRCASVEPSATCASEPCARLQK